MLEGFDGLWRQFCIREAENLEQLGCLSNNLKDNSTLDYAQISAVGLSLWCSTSVFTQTRDLGVVRGKCGESREYIGDCYLVDLGCLLTSTS